MNPIPSIQMNMTSVFHDPESQSVLLVDPESQEHESDRRVLIVDDEDAVRKMFASYLSDRYECTMAASTDEALALLAVESYALVIADMMMPGRSGVELLREVTSGHPDTVVIMVSAVDRPQRIRDALRVGAFDYLIKPCELDVLLFSVERGLERRALKRTARIYKGGLEKKNAELETRTAELQRLQAQIIHSSKMASLGQLAAGIAHELNNPANFINGNMEFLREGLVSLNRVWAVYDDESLPAELAARVSAVKEEVGYENILKDLHSIFADCREGAERIGEVVQNLRVFSRLDEAEFKKADIHEGIESTIRLLSRFYSGGHITLRREYGNLPPVNCYAGQLNQVWMNLLVNAAQAIEDRGEVCIKTRFDSHAVHVAISDTGCGITEEHLDKIFDPFFTTKPVGEGTGLGLSITYGIIERHGGSITVESSKYAGTTFTITIPWTPKP
jgi:two-component system NtrC family sensor kinase